MISRRSFLKLFSSLPLVSALPATAEVLKEVEADAPAANPYLGDNPCIQNMIDAEVVNIERSWLRLNGVPVEARSIEVQQDHPRQIDCTMLRAAAAKEYILGMAENTFVAEIVGLPATGINLHKGVKIEAAFPQGYAMVANGLLVALEQSLQVGTVPFHRLTIRLDEMEWRLHDQALYRS